MKKYVASVLILTLLFALPVLPAAAEDTRVNVFTMENVYPSHTIGLNATSAYVPEYVCDGFVDYNKDNSSTFCDHRMTASQKDVQNGTAPLYNIAGVTGAADSKYLCILFFELNQLYTLDGFSFYCSNVIDGIPTNVNVDGVDILLSETGLDDEWKLVYSGTELHCGKKYLAHNETAYITADFEATKAQYIAFGLTQPRCRHTEALKAAYNLEISEHPEYFRITELEFYGKAEEIHNITTEVIAPAVTDAPTPALPTPATLNYEAILVTVLLMGMAAAALLVARESKRQHGQKENRT
ncbi:MAG: hypothetical protein IJZ02_01915 [Clostridia bacterium]|nr:hypothetical protein [Clostridia bacterium]